MLIFGNVMLCFDYVHLFKYVWYVHASDLVIMCWMFAKVLGKCMLGDLMFGDILLMFS